MSPAHQRTQKINLEEDMPIRCLEHIRVLDAFDARLTNLENVCQDLKDLPSKVASIATTLKIQTLFMGGVLAAMAPKIIERLFP